MTSYNLYFKDSFILWGVGEMPGSQWRGCWYSKFQEWWWIGPGESGGVGKNGWLLTWFEGGADMIFWWSRYRVRRGEKTKMMPRFLTWVTRSVELPFPEIGRLWDNQVWGSLVLFIKFDTSGGFQFLS